jgi:hypothetical protein
MPVRMTIFFLIVLFAVPLALAKNKKKQVLPDYVLKAETVAVVIRPYAGEPVTNPTANRTAEDNVERALLQWGRFRLVTDTSVADLVIAVRKGHASGPAVDAPTDNRPVIIQQAGGNTRVGVQQGQPSDPTYPVPPSGQRMPQVGSEVGPSEDLFEVYIGGEGSIGRPEYPLDAPSIWRYMGKNALDGPQVKAVEEFKNAITESEQAKKQKP